MARPTDTPEAALAREAHRMRVLAYFSAQALAAGRPHVKLFARGGSLAEFQTIDEAREWLRLEKIGGAP